jgi:hypothetical protein
MANDGTSGPAKDVEELRSWRGAARDIWHGRDVHFPEPLGSWTDQIGWKLELIRKVGRAGLAVVVAAAGWGWLVLTEFPPMIIRPALFLFGYWALWALFSGPRQNPRRETRKRFRDYRWIFPMAGVVDVRPEVHPSFMQEVLDRRHARRATRLTIDAVATLNVVSLIVLTFAGNVRPLADYSTFVVLLGPVLAAVWLNGLRNKREWAFRKAVEDATFRPDLPDIPTLDERLASHRAELARLNEMRSALDAGNAERYQELAQQVVVGPQAIVLRAELEAVVDAGRTSEHRWNARLAVGCLVAGWVMGLVTDIIRH